MNEEVRDDLKLYFETGDKPTQEQFADLIDSNLNKKEDQVFVGKHQTTGKVQIGIGAPVPQPAAGDLQGHIRFSVKERLSTHQLQLRDGDTASGNVLASDGFGNAVWTKQTALNDGDWRVNGNEMYSMPSGNVGIGTNQPSEKLTVVGGSAKVNDLSVFAGLHLENRALFQWAKTGITFSNTNTTSKYQLILNTEVQSTNGNPAITNEIFSLGRTYHDQAGNYTGQASYLSINPAWGGRGKMIFSMDHNQGGSNGDFAFTNGNVGINTLNPSAELDIDGLAKTKELEITNLANSTSDNILVQDANGKVATKSAQDFFSTNGFSLWEMESGKIVSKPGHDVYTKRRLMVGGSDSTIPAIETHDGLAVKGSVLIENDDNNSNTVLRIHNKFNTDNSHPHQAAVELIIDEWSTTNRWKMGAQRNVQGDSSTFYIKRYPKSGNTVAHLAIDDAGDVFVTGRAGEAKMRIMPPAFSSLGHNARLELGDSLHFISAHFGGGMTIGDTDQVRMTTPQFEISNGGSNPTTNTLLKIDANRNFRLSPDSAGTGSWDRPIVFKSFEKESAGTTPTHNLSYVEIPTLVPTSKYVACLSGVYRNGNNGLVRAHINEENGYWEIRCEKQGTVTALVGGSKDFWRVDVIFIRKELCGIG